MGGYALKDLGPMIFLILMNKGHLEVGEIAVIALLLIGIVVGVFMLMSPPPQTGGAQPVADNTSTVVSNSSPSVPVPPAKIPQNVSPSVQAQVNESLGQLMDEGMVRADSRFYDARDFVAGNYSINTYRFALGNESNPPDSIPVVKNDVRVSNVLFNGHYVDSLRAFIFRAYILKDLSGPQKIYGTAVFFSNETPLDSLANFTMYYGTDPQGPQELDGCAVLSKNVSLTMSGNETSIYDVSCKYMSAAYP